MDLLKAIQDDVLKQKEEEAVNLFSRVVDFREFITTTQPAADVTVTLKCCCLSSERLNGGRGTRVTGVDASQYGVFEPTSSALSELTPLKRKPYIVQVTVWDAKPKKGSFGKANLDFQPGAVYTFRNADGVGFYADIAKGSVQFERDDNDKIFESHPPLKKRKLTRETPKKGGKNKLAVGRTSGKGAAAELVSEIDINMESKEGEEIGVVATRSKSSSNVGSLA